MPRQQSTWTKADEARLKDLNGQGLSMTAIAKEMGRTNRAVSVKAKALGLVWTGVRNKNMALAHAARRERIKELRHELTLGLMEDAARLRSELWSPSTVYSFGGRENTYAEAVMDQPPHADQLKIMQAASTAVMAAVRLEEREVSGADGAAGLLTELAQSMGLDDLRPAGSDKTPTVPAKGKKA